jgi:hypothetical protein
MKTKYYFIVCVIAVTSQSHVRHYAPRLRPATVCPLYVYSVDWALGRCIYDQAYTILYSSENQLTANLKLAELESSAIRLIDTMQPQVRTLLLRKLGILSQSVLEIQYLQRITEANLHDLFDLDYMKFEFELHGLRIDTHAFHDESKVFVIIECTRS